MEEFTSKEDSLKHNSNCNIDLFLALPDEMIEEILSYLPNSDLYNWKKEGGRQRDCVNRVLTKKPFSKFTM